MLTYILFSVYIIGVLICIYLVYIINTSDNKKSNDKLTSIEIIFMIYLVLISWIGVLALLAGALAHGNSIDEDNE